MERAEIDREILKCELSESGSITEHARAVLGRELAKRLDIDRRAARQSRLYASLPKLDEKLLVRLAALPSADPTPGKQDERANGTGNGQGEQPTPSAALGNGQVTKDSGHFAYSPAKRRKIVIEFHTARDRGEVENKHAWAKKYGIDGKTLKSYEDENPDV